MVNKVIIPKGSVAETLLIPLYGRKVANEVYPFFFSDPEAKKIIDNIDYDFSKMEEQYKRTFYRFGILELAMRQSAFSIEVKDFCASHKGAALINLGCGLDTTLEREASKDSLIYNIDLPDVIKARESLVAKGENVTNLSFDINDYKWMDEIKGENGVMFMASGLFYYFLKDDVKALFNELSKRFPKGIIVFDAANKRATKTMNKTYLKKNKMKVTSFFYLADADKELSSWSPNYKVSSKGYMLGYIDFSKDKRVPSLHRRLAKVADGSLFKMRIIKIIL